MITRIFSLFIIAVLCFACSSGGDGTNIQDTFLGSVQFGQQKQEVLDELYQQHFVDAASGQADSHFDTIPLDNGDYSELKILASKPAATDTAAMEFAFLGQRWLNVQIQFDGNGLYCLTFRAKSAKKETTNVLFSSVLKTLQKSYAMKRMVIGHSSAEGEPTDIMGYRYENDGKMVQLYIDENPDGTSAAILSYIANNPQP